MVTPLWARSRRKLSIILLLILPFLVVILIISRNTRSIFSQQQYFSSENIDIYYDRRLIVNNDISEEFQQCDNMKLLKAVRQRGKYWVLHNYVAANREFGCSESITYTTNADFRFLENLLPLVDIWQGPISVALYAPGDDFFVTLDTIAYLRQCTSNLIKEFVTFHIFFENIHMPRQVQNLIDIYNDTFDCSKQAPYVKVSTKSLYKSRKKLTFPINVARNIARDSAQTYFVLPSDIELYPTPNFIPKFLNMIRSYGTSIDASSRNVYVLPLFEVKENFSVPLNKTALHMMYLQKNAFLFHHTLCKSCHHFPEGSEWLAAAETEELDVFAEGKRHGQFIYWEPFFVSTKREPIFDERLSWEGQGNKMSQAYALCLLDYKFMILNNAFLVHKPGIKKKKEQLVKHMDLVSGNNKLLRTIAKELVVLFGNNSQCKISA